MLFSNWGVELDQVGRPLEAERVYRRVLQINRDNHTDDAVFPSVLINYARILRQLNRLQEAADYAERAYTKAKRAGHELAVADSDAARCRRPIARRPQRVLP